MPINKGITQFSTISTVIILIYIERRNKMKLLIEKNVLLESLSNVVRAVSPRNIIPILNGIMFDLNEDGLYLTASDSDIIIRNFIPKEKIKNIVETGKIIIQSKYLLEIIKKMPNTDINIEVIDGLKIIISTDATVYNLNCLNSDDYPNINLETVNNPIVLNSSILKEMISQTLFAISTQESRPLLTGLNIKINGNVMECVTTDSYRLAKKTIVLNDNYNTTDIVIPGKNIQEFDKILNEEADVEIHLFNNKVLFVYNNYIFQTSLLSGNYPNTSNLIPADFSFVISTNLDNFYSAIDRAALLTQNKDKNLINMKTENNDIVITSFASEIGKSEERILVSKNTSEDISISYSAKYMLDALKTFKEDDLIILMNGDSKPIILKNAKDESLIQLILPIKTY